MNRVLWAIQGLLAGLFVFAGGAKLMLPIEPMVEQSHLPAALLQFVGVCEILGAVGLILPRRVNILPVLTPIAATGLGIIMIGAVAMSASLGPAMVLFPLATLALCAFVAWGRWKLVP
jgi:hypothetical protein